MPRMVIEVPEEFTEVGKVMAEHLAALQRTVSRLGGGKAVDYAEIEQAMAESAGRAELAGHRAILQSLDIDVPAVTIGGVRYTRVGRCEAPYHTMAGWVSVERSLYRSELVSTALRRNCGQKTLVRSFRKDIRQTSGATGRYRTGTRRRTEKRVSYESAERGGLVWSEQESPL